MAKNKEITRVLLVKVCNIIFTSKYHNLKVLYMIGMG